MSALITISTILLISFVETSYQQGYAFPRGITECHPIPDPSKTQYLVGYGSLISSESKDRTYPDTGPNIPVNITGFKRTWTARGSTNVSLSTTYLGVDIDRRASLNGVIFSVPNSEAVEKYDNRERLYCRVKVPNQQVSIIRGSVSDNETFPSEAELENSEFWIYVTSPTFRHFPDDRYPIVQSYVDIFLGGCISLERKYGLEKFAVKCITTTEGWNNPWVNDRLHPRRPFTYLKDSWSIDQLIAKYIPGYNTYLEKIFVGRSVNAGSRQESISVNTVLATTALLVAPTFAAVACVR